MKKITAESLFDLKSIAQPIQVEENIYYIENSMNQEKNRYESTIFSYNLKTKEKIEWGNNGYSVNLLKVSPNKKYLSFLASDDEKKQQIMLMPLKGGRAFYLTNEKEGVSSYLWNETGSSVYYQTSTLPEKEVDDKVPQTKSWSKLSYKVDGTGLIAEDKTYQLKKQDLALPQMTHLILEKKYSFSLNHLSKDESFALITEDLDEDDELNYGSTVYHFDLRTKVTYSLTSSIEQGSFSFGAIRNDQDVLLVGNDFRYGFVTQDKLYLYNLTTSKLTCLTSEADLQVGDALISDFQQKNLSIEIHWLDDETYFFPVTESGKVTLYKGDKKGNIKKIVDKKLHLTDGSLLNNERMVVAYSTLTNPSVLALLDLTTGKLTDIENPNEEFLAKTKLSKPDMFWYQGVNDWDIQGWYVPPVESKKNYPVILYIHGGPQVAYGESFFHEMQVHAANGYGVIMLNPRGGQGYGQEFVKAILGDYGNEDYQDLMLGLDYVLTEYPEIDKNNVYVAGGSYGGFMTNWIVGHTNRFKAAVTQRSISNWISFYGTSDIGSFFVKYQLNRDLKDIDKLWQLSPLAYADNVDTPLLVLHGEEDLRCPQEQGEQMYTAVKMKGVPTKMVVFPESSHGLSRQGLPNLRMERINEIVNWFSQY
ncbi:dipeptidyl aminopeptidase/acylaminoacyl peptidase [Vagococcus fluvialis]|uniref:Peptidase S9 prolyl oligopeptidase catalytic domain-containing protein n=1 Tax=Vagococcus fluvialis TaxID=2738 RepID=A0A369AYS9_9ENTE|nr:S9 family peptidase [Vagococcus fluvialis]RCX13347.1 dipeptidyl aminopeptidase/acylaminoacyl peptidase [Vagococcus fluvialis]RSU01797.1 hypothetical protein CBF32_07310 [Vagococcus fluvialis]